MSPAQSLSAWQAAIWQVISVGPGRGAGVGATSEVSQAVPLSHGTVGAGAAPETDEPPAPVGPPGSAEGVVLEAWQVMPLPQSEFDAQTCATLAAGAAMTVKASTEANP